MASLKKIRRKRRREMEKRAQNAKLIEDTLSHVNAVKMISMLVLRNNGWGNVRIQRFSDDFDVIINDVSEGYLSIWDIPSVLEEETGLESEKLIVK